MKLLTIDIFGTLLTPRPSVASQYLSLVSKLEPHLFDHVTDKKSRDLHVTQIQTRFNQAFAEHYAKHPFYGKNSTGYELWWHHVIRETFAQYPISRDTTHNLYLHFTNAQAYHLYADVIPLLQQVKSMGFKVAALSNMDPKARDLLHGFGLSRFFDHVFLSYDTEIDKPDLAAWDHVTQHFGVSERYYNSLYHVGDESAKDLVSIPGWTSVLIDRSEGHKVYGDFEAHKVYDDIVRVRVKKMREGVLRVREDQFVVKSLMDVPDLIV